jgi:hypothetical protein
MGSVASHPGAPFFVRHAGQSQAGWILLTGYLVGIHLYSEAPGLEDMITRKVHSAEVGAMHSRSKRFKVLATTAISIFAALLVIFLALRFGLLRRRFMTVDEVNHVLIAGHLEGSSPDQVAAFLKSRNIKYFLSAENGMSIGSHSMCPIRLTGVVAPSSKGFFNVGEITINFHFSQDCKLTAFLAQEHFISP